MVSPAIPETDQAIIRGAAAVDIPALLRFCEEQLAEST